MDALTLRHLRGELGRAVDDRRGALGWERGQPAVLGAEHSVGGDERERAPARALAEDEGDRRRVEVGEVGERTGDLSGYAALLGGLGERGTGGVDDGDERGGRVRRRASFRAWPRARRRAERGPGVLAEAVLAEDDARGGPELREREQEAGILLSLAGAVERRTVFAAVRNRSRTPGRSPRRERVIACHASASGSTVSGRVSGSGTRAGTSLAPMRTSRTRETVAWIRSGPMTASMIPCLWRFSPVWTFSGNGSP